jgi:RHS repeat-associated protein
LGNNVTTTYSYFPLNFRLQRLQIGNAQAFTYGYDNVGNVLTLTMQITQPTASTEVMAFNYDALDRLTNAVAVTNGYTGTYGYDAIDNLITKTESGPTVLYTYGVTQPHAVKSLSNGNSYTYDLNGNTPALALSCDGASAGCTTRKRGASVTRRMEITNTTNTYTQTWDVENRLTTVTGTMVYSCRNCPAPITSISKFTYDGDGNRVLQVNISGTQIITTAYAGALEVQITATQRITKTYYSAGSQLIALRAYTSPTSSVLYFLHGDHLGSTSLTTDQNGNVVARQLYDAWGNVRLRGDVKTDLGYTSQREDVSTNLMFYRARYYSPGLGRFISADTIVPEPGNPQSLNRFAYGLNNPVKYRDPSGHDVDCGIGESNCHRKPKKTNVLPPIQQCTDTCPKDAATRANAEEAFRLFLSNPGYYA